jgi:hypothetical protein
MKNNQETPNTIKKLIAAGAVVLAGSLALNTSPAHAEDTTTASSPELQSAKHEVKNVSRRVAKHIGQKFVRVEKITRELNHAADSSSLTITTPNVEGLPHLAFTYYTDSHSFEVFESSRANPDHAGRHDSFAGRFKLPDNDNLIYGAFLTGDVEKIGAAEIRDLLVRGTYSPVRVNVSNHESATQELVIFGYGGGPQYGEGPNGPQLISTHVATEAELLDFAAHAKQADRSPALSFTSV